MHIHIHVMTHESLLVDIGGLRLVGSLNLYGSFAKEPYETDDILPTHSW